MKKHIMPLLFGFWPYLFALLALIPEEWIDTLVSVTGIALGMLVQTLGSVEACERFVTVCGIVLVVLFCVLVLAGILYPLRTKSLTMRELARWDLIIKLAHIPVYVVLFLFAMLMLLSIAAPAVFMMALISVPIIFFFHLALMLNSSCYGFRALYMAKQDGLVDKKWANRHIIAHCFFVSDVISAFLIWRKLKKEN